MQYSKHAGSPMSRPDPDQTGPVPAARTAGDAPRRAASAVRLRLGAILVGFWVLVPPVPALDSDSKQPMYIEANTATYDEKKGITVYTGDVKATQGSLEVLGDQMTVYQKGGKSDKIVILGRPARLKQTPEGGSQDMHGIGQRADYFPETGVLILYEKAEVWQGPDPATSEQHVKSDRIEYDTRNSLFKAGTAGTGGKRVQVIIQPKEQAPKKPAR